MNKIKDKLNEIMIHRNTNKFHNYSLAKLRWKQATRRIVTQNYVSKVTKHLETLSARGKESKEFINEFNTNSDKINQLNNGISIKLVNKIQQNNWTSSAPTSPRRDHIPELLHKKQSIVVHVVHC
mmetsp:Transcript_18781/g.17001  ORF Transcript_18781/g.17001 Transcript_18781/m.17001 type:complete len:125 (+) Transcript_18781:318-692(+)